MFKWIEKSLEKRPIVTIVVLSVVAVSVASGLGVMSPITKVVGRAVGSIKFAVMKIFGADRRQAARAA